MFTFYHNTFEIKQNLELFLKIFKLIFMDFQLDFYFQNRWSSLDEFKK